MENHNIGESQGKLIPDSIKISTNINDNNKNDSPNNVCSIFSMTESNNLMLTEINENKEKYNDGDLNELLRKYLNSPNNNDINLKNKDIHFSFSHIFKQRENIFECELYDNFSIYQTMAHFKEGEYNQNIKRYKECRLVLKDGYLYVLNIYNNRKKIINNFINPENSFLLQLEKNKNIHEEDKNFIKYDYELSQPLLCLNLNLISCILLINKMILNEFSIFILGTHKKYSFIIEDKQTKEKFCFLIGNLIYNSEGYISNKLALVLNDKKFYSKTYITAEDFEYIAKTGDLLLFKTKHILADIQRFFTCDTYDHIAFIHSNYGFITLFDASKKGTCQPHYWGSFRYSMNNLSFDKVCYRRLNIEEKNYEEKMKIQEKIENLTDQFMNEVTDKKYYLSFCNLLFKGKPKKYELSGEWHKSEGFSCSSLVAALYIKLGIIKLKNSIHSIKPGDFEQNKNLYFLPGFSLGPEKIIEFSS